MAQIKCCLLLVLSVFSLSAGANRSASTCGSCGVMEELRQRSLQRIQMDILDKLGFSSPPNITKFERPNIPLKYLEQIEMQNDQAMDGYNEPDDFHVHAQTVLSFAHPYPRMRHSWKFNDIMYFTFSNTTTKYNVQNATMFLYLKPAAKHSNQKVLIEVYQLVSNSSHQYSSPELKLMFSKKVTQPVGAGEWFSFDISKTVREWFKKRKEKYSFVINPNMGGKKVVVTNPDDEGGGNIPYVEVSISEGKRRRRRNTGRDCHENANTPTCCRYPLTVDFEEMGWGNFIIAPKRYEAYHCAGECPMLTYQIYPHTHLTHLASPKGPPPCCVPRKMRGITLVYFDENGNIICGKLQGMVVEQCGCS